MVKRAGGNGQIMKNLSQTLENFLNADIHHKNRDCQTWAQLIRESIISVKVLNIIVALNI